MFTPPLEGKNKFYSEKDALRHIQLIVQKLSEICYDSDLAQVFVFMSYFDQCYIISSKSMIYYMTSSYLSYLHLSNMLLDT